MKSPYRNKSCLDEVDKPKPQYGVLKGNAVHECPLPGFLDRIFRGIREETYWRCGCERVWIWANAYHTIYKDSSTQHKRASWCEWQKSSIEEWIKAGGSE